MSLGEFELIAKIREKCGRPSARVLVGIGDDAAVLVPPSQNLLATVDSLVEGVHFDLAHFLPEEVGHKALAVNLSDIAAMGGLPLYALVSLGLGEGLRDNTVLNLMNGLHRLAQEYAVDIVGGNISRIEGKSFVDVTLLGEASERPLVRGDAEVGDCLAVTGSLGRAAAGYQLLKKYGRTKMDAFPTCYRAQLTPDPRVNFGNEWGTSGLGAAMVDISDGFAGDLSHLGEASGVGFEVWGDKLPVSDEVKAAAVELKADWKHWALYGGEDYELLFTFRESESDAVQKLAESVGVAVTVVGTVVEAAQGTSISWGGAAIPLKGEGWDHLQNH